MYRYDRNDYDCEVFRFARLRARNLHRFFKTMYCGDVEDLEQAAMIAAVQVGDAAADQQRVPFEDLKKAVDRAVRDEAGGLCRQDANTEDGQDRLRLEGPKAQAARPETEASEEKAAAARFFRNSITSTIGEERYQRLLAYYVEFGGGRQAAAQIAAKINENKKPRYRVSAEKVQREIEDDARMLASKVSEKAIRKLVEARDPVP